MSRLTPYQRRMADKDNKPYKHSKKIFIGDYDTYIEDTGSGTFKIVSPSSSIDVTSDGTMTLSGSITVNSGNIIYTDEIRMSDSWSMIRGLTDENHHIRFVNTPILDNALFFYIGEGSGCIFSQASGFDGNVNNSTGLDFVWRGISDNKLFWVDSSREKINVARGAFVPDYELHVGGTVHATTISGTNFNSNTIMNQTTTEPTKTMGTLWMSSNSAGTECHLYMISGDNASAWQLVK
jgi:hypothetical protein